MRTANLADTFTGPSKYKPMKKKLEKWERGRIQGPPLSFEYPLLSREHVKLRTSSFVRTLLVPIGTNARYKFREK